ncbi:MAG: HEAT repeat domain-containing protein [Fibrobacterota bacterium]
MKSNGLKEMLVSSVPRDVVEGLRQITLENLVPNLPFVIDLIRRHKAGGDDPSIRLASEALRTLLKFPENVLKGDARDTLGKLLLRLDPDLVSHLLSDFAASDPKAKIDALYLLQSFQNSKVAAQVLVQALSDENKLVRAVAVKALGLIANRREPGIIARFIADADARVRANAVEAIESTENPNCVGILLRIRNDKNNRVRANVLKALVTCGYTAVEKDLMAMLRSTDERMRASAAWAIGEAGKKEPKLALLLPLLDNEKSELVQLNTLLAKDKIARAVDKKADGGVVRPRGLKGEIIRRSAVTLTRGKARYFHILRISGRLNIYSMIPVKLALQEMLDSEMLSVALDFKRVDDVDNAAIHFLRNVNKRIKAANGKFMVFNVRRDILEAFNLSNLNSTVLVFSEEEKTDHLLN